MELSKITKEPVFYGIIGAIISIIITYLDTKIFKDEKNKLTYFKIGFLTFIIVIIILYFINFYSLNIATTITTGCPNLNTDLQTGTPDF
jgi:hypothetical protein